VSSDRVAGRHDDHQRQSPLLFVIEISVAGIGFGFMYLPSIVMVSFYFDKRRALATGLAVCGSGVGTFVLAPFFNFIVSEYGWKVSEIGQVVSRFQSIKQSINHWDSTSLTVKNWQVVSLVLHRYRTKKSRVRKGGWERIYGGKGLWKRCVLSLECSGREWE